MQMLAGFESDGIAELRIKSRRMLESAYTTMLLVDDSAGRGMTPATCHIAIRLARELEEKVGNKRRAADILSTTVNAYAQLAADGPIGVEDVSVDIDSKLQRLDELMIPEDAIETAYHVVALVIELERRGKGGDGDDGDGDEDDPELDVDVVALCLKVRSIAEQRFGPASEVYGNALLRFGVLAVERGSKKDGVEALKRARNIFRVLFGMSKANKKAMVIERMLERLKGVGNGGDEGEDGEEEEEEEEEEEKEEEEDDDNANEQQREGSSSVEAKEEEKEAEKDDDEEEAKEDA